MVLQTNTTQKASAQVAKLRGITVQQGTEVIFGFQTTGRGVLSRWMPKLMMVFYRMM